MMSYWRVAVEAPMPEALTYSSPLELNEFIVPGSRVNIPLGRRSAKGIVIGPATKPTEFEAKNITSIDTEFAPLSAKILEWLLWISQYYIYPVGLVTSLPFPPLRKPTKARKSSRVAVVPLLTEERRRPQLTDEQSKIVEDISKHTKFGAHLIYGVTGSGKTEVYLHLLEKVLAEGKAGLFLVPEISLTPQMIQRFSSRFPDQVAVLHSQLTDRERTSQWWDIVEGRKKILVGARSAIFCPIPNLGMIVVDEEHEPSFKQDEKLKYHGRDCAIMLGKMLDCPVLLGSATPSLETWAHATSGRYTLNKMSHRVENRALPQLQIIDLRSEEKKNFDLPAWMSDRLFKALEQTYKNGKQSALFLNRRGMAPLVLCEMCGFVHECPNCDISLTLHRHIHLICHYCDYHENFKEACPSCKKGEMRAVGLGTEQVEKDLQRLFPEARVKRADRDEIQNRQDLEELIRDMESGETNFLVGTQMIAKGLDFPLLHTVGLVLADIGFNIPDFRSPERSYQLITQVSGRAGRHVKPGEEPGQVLIQTYNPDHPSLIAAFKQDFESLAEEELRTRQELGYPPFGRLASLRIQSSHQHRAFETSQLIGNRARSLQGHAQIYNSIEVLGPCESPMAKLRNKYRFQMLLKCKDPRHLNKFCYQLLGDESWIPNGVKVSIDVDPLNLL